MESTLFELLAQSQSFDSYKLDMHPHNTTETVHLTIHTICMHTIFNNSNVLLHYSPKGTAELFSFEMKNS
jgi:hypothetical protein